MNFGFGILSLRRARGSKPVILVAFERGGWAYVAASSRHGVGDWHTTGLVVSFSPGGLRP